MIPRDSNLVIFEGSGAFLWIYTSKVDRNLNFKIKFLVMGGANFENLIAVSESGVLILLIIKFCILPDNLPLKDLEMEHEYM